MIKIAGLLLASVTLALGLTFSFPEGGFTAASMSSLQLNGRAAVYNPNSENYLYLTRNLGTEVGSAFLTSSVPLGSDASFSTVFGFKMTSGGGSNDGSNLGADGIVFIVNGITNIVGGNGGGIGFSGLGQSVGIELDSWYNPEFGDINGNHVGIDFNGVINSVQQVNYPTLFNNGATRYCWVDFNGVNKTLEVRVADSIVRPINPLMTRNIDLAAVLGTQDVYVGFSAATGAAWENHIITSWQFTNIFKPIVTVCGNNVIEVGEICDGGSCCSANCTFKASSAICRASNGDCDAAETCTGSSASCPADSFRASSVTCRASNGDCDVAETCTGSSASCPADSFQSSSVTCRASNGPCDLADTCTGSSASCPADSFQASSVTCRASNGDCDVEETCTGSSASCPADSFQSSSVTCRASNGPCDVDETCTGSSATCPADSFASSAVTCRAASSVCDVAETCTGSSASCPEDSFASSTTVCRASIGHCDPSESCTGSNAVCPADISGHFESACPGLSLNFGEAGTFSFVDYDVISFNSIVGPTGAIDGRAAAKGNVTLGTSFSGGYSIGYGIHSGGTDNVLPYSLVAGGDLIFGGGAVYPDGLHNGPQENIFVGTGSFSGQADLGARVTGNCNGNTGCLDSAFSAAQACYGGFQAAWASNPSNVQKTIEWSGLSLDCQDPTSAVTTYYLELTPAEMSQYTWISMSNCNANARWIINVVGTADVTFTAGSFPASTNAVIYNVVGSGRTVNVQNIFLQGHIVAPYNILNQPNGNVVGKVIAANIPAALNINRQGGNCFVPQ